jgi:2-aminoethylphosphonate-pyruvate transaminase
MKLFIPGPVTTRPEVRAALAQDFAPWDNDFRPIYADVRARLLAIAGGDERGHTTLMLQGCGHYATEAALRTFIPAGGKILVPATGAYAARMVRLAGEAGRIVVPLPVPSGERVSPDAVAAALAADPTISHAGLVYSETGTGICHDVIAIGQRVAALGRRTILDAVSAFGALPLDVSAMPEADAVIFTPNKCLEGVPGLSMVIVPIERVAACAGQAGSWSFDLADIHTNSLRNGPGGWRFTPPAQVLAALAVALDLYEAEGGRGARLARYTANMRALHTGIQRIGLTPCLSEAVQGPIVVNVHSPADPHWNLQAFVDALKRRGVLISNFHNTPFPSFRVGCIGALTPDDMREAVAAMGEALDELGVRAREAA